MAQDTPSRHLDQFMLRLPDGMRDRIAEEAKVNGRSMNAEIVSRLRQSLEINNSIIVGGRSYWANEKKEPEDAKYILYEIQRQAMENLSVTESLLKALNKLGVEVYVPPRDRDDPMDRPSDDDPEGGELSGRRS